MPQHHPMKPPAEMGAGGRQVDAAQRARSPVQLAEAMAAGEWSREEMQPWLQRGMQRYFQGSASLEIALQINPQARKRERDDALRAADRVLSEGAVLERGARAVRLRDAILRFRAGKLLHLRRGAEVALELFERYLLQAENLAPLPRVSVKHLARILDA